MKVTKKILTIAAAGALTVATALPAFALENEFHGFFALRAVNSNTITAAQVGPLYPFNASGQTVANASTKTNNWFEQRARLFYTAKANDDLKLVTGFEIDANWGRSAYTDGRNQGGALGADTASIESKWVYLDFNIPSTKINVKGGVQGLNDAYKSLFVGGGADAAGLLVSSPFGPSKVTLGFFRLDDRTFTAPSTTASSNGKATRDLLILDAKCTAMKDMTFGASYYFLNSDNSVSMSNQSGTTGIPTATAGAVNDYNVHVLGLNAATKLGDATIDGFFLYEFGTVDSIFGETLNAHVNAFAANLAGKMKVGPGTAKVSALYVSGGSNAFVNVNNETSAAFSENNFGNAIGNVLILARNPFLTQTESAIIYDSSNLGMGIIGGSVGYDANITDKLFAGANAAFAGAAKSLSGHDSKYQGTELNGEIGYKMYDALTVGVNGAYVILGDFYKGADVTGDPDDPYIAQAYLKYVF
jgi:hypothetical protein